VAVLPSTTNQYRSPGGSLIERSPCLPGSKTPPYRHLSPQATQPATNNARALGVPFDAIELVEHGGFGKIAALSDTRPPNPKEGRQMKVNSYDEWSALKEVILGSATNYIFHERELSFDLFYHLFYHHFFHNHVQDSERAYPGLSGPGNRERNRTRAAISQLYIDELNEDLDGMEKALTDLGVKVLRPLELSEQTGEVTTLDWSASVVPPLNIRDNTVILGDEILETAPMIRSRYFETRFLQPIFMDYFRQGCRWSTMPRPIMTDRSFDPSYAQSRLGGPAETVYDPLPSAYDVGFEIMIDGAQCLRLGKDVIVNVATANHQLGLDWLQAHFGDRFRFHRIDRLCDHHIDSMLLALRPGMLLIRHEGVLDYLPEKLRSWDYIVSPTVNANNYPTYDRDDLIITSPYIDLNVLSIDEQTVMVNEACPELVTELERHGFTAVPVRHRHRRLFGGGFHCFTLDTVRAGGLEDYLD
jgi:glycine amidinotransferase